MLVKNNDSLKFHLDKIVNSKFITIDTEFMRDKFYYPKLSLIQICGDNISFAVDALSEVDINLLKPLFRKKITKVLHSCKQDLEIFYNTFGFIPAKIFDTQIAMQFLGYRDSPSYETLINDFLNIKISKKLQFSDWLQRPLTTNQIQYALQDVSLLYETYPLIEERISKLGRLKWLREECALLENDTSFNTSEFDLLRKFVNSLDNQEQIENCLKVLRIREDKAKTLNKARSHILHDNDIITILKFNDVPKKTKLSPDEISGALKLDLDEGDKLIIEKAIKFSKYRRGEKVESFLHLRKLLHTIAEQENISPTLIATSDEIIKFSNGIKKNIRFLSGWRREIYGNKASELI